jgi:hypothetical protein
MSSRNCCCAEKDHYFEAARIGKTPLIMYPAPAATAKGTLSTMDPATLKTTVFVVPVAA